MGKTDHIRFRHRLWPLERVSARWLIHRQRARGSAAGPSFEQVLGVEGIALLACLYLWGLTGAFLVFIGLAFLFGSGVDGTLAPVGYVLLLGAAISVGGGQVRAAQMRRERDLLHASTGN
jgi:hypothetical protein